MIHRLLVVLLLLCISSSRIVAFRGRTNSILQNKLQNHPTKITIHRQHRFKYHSTSSRFFSLITEIRKEVCSSKVIADGFCRGLQLSKAVVKVAWDYASNRHKYINQAGKVSFAAFIRHLFEEMGATYIKLGQLVASSPSVFPEEYVKEFQVCFDKTPPVPFENIVNIIQSDLKQPLHRIFSHIDPVPIATASIAQVHVCTLLDGSRVVVKVRKPAVEATMKTDLTFLVIASKLLEALNPSISPLSLSRMVEDLRDSMIDELDFRKELVNIDNFRQFVECHGLDDVVAPKVYRQYSTERVLTMEYLPGVPLVKYLSSSDDEGNPDDAHRILSIVMNAWMLSINENDRFHADLHAGNILVLSDGKVGFLDFGIVGKIDSRFRKNVQAFYKAFTQDDYYGMARSLVSIGATGSNVDLESFSSELYDTLASIRLLKLDEQMNLDGTEDFISVNDSVINTAFVSIFDLVERHGLRMPREFGLLLKQALYFDRYYQILGAYD